MSYLANLFIYLCVYAILAMSLNIVTGYSGLVNLAHAAFFGVGAYATALSMKAWGWGFLPAVCFAVLLSATLSLAISLPALRFRSSFFVIASLAVQSMTYNVLYNWTGLTNGPHGLSAIPRPRFFGASVGLIGMTCVAGGTALLCGFVVYRMLHSPWGRLLQAVRDDELAARSVGKDANLARIQATAVACGVASVAGALYATYVGYIDPTSFGLEESILLLSMVLIGGTGNVRGPLVGAAALIGIQELLRFVDVPGQMASHLRLMVYGLLLIFIAHQRPHGLAGRYRFR